MEKFREWTPPDAMGVVPETITEPFTIVLWGITSESMSHWAKLKAVADARAGGKLGAVAQPVRVMVTGATASPAIDVTLALLGRERTLARLADPANRKALGG